MDDDEEVPDLADFEAQEEERGETAAPVKKLFGGKFKSGQFYKALEREISLISL